MIIKDSKLYDVLKWLGRCVIPGLGAFYLLLSKLWGLPCGPEISGTAAGLTVFINTILGISNKNYEEAGNE